MEYTIVIRARNPTRLLRLSPLLIFLCASLVQWNTVALAQENPRASTRESSRSLPLPSRTGAVESETPRKKSITGSNSLLTTALSLGLIVGALVIVGRVMKRYGFQSRQSLPADAFEILGRRQIDSRTAVHLVKCGSRILVLGVGTEGIRTLSEIDDPVEVERLTDACQQSTAADQPTSRPSRTKQAVSPSPASTAAQRAFMAVVAIGIGLANVAPVQAQTTRVAGPRIREQAEIAQPARPAKVHPAAFEAAAPGGIEMPTTISPQQWGLSLKMLALMTIFSLAPSILMMTTCFVRFTVVLGLLRQAIGTQQGPPNQVLTAICLFLTFLVMSPIWQRSYQEGIRPFTNPAPGEQNIDEATALARTIAPVRSFMSQQIDKAGNADAIWMLLDYQRPDSESASQNWIEPQSYDEVPFTVLAPAYLLSELKVAFLIGFQLFLPFLVIDLVVATILTSLGLTMLPPSMVSIPFKLLLFVLIDGWFLTVGMLLESVRVA